MVREANGQYDSIRAKSVKRCLFGGSRKLQFLNMRKASYSFHSNLIQLHAEKTSPKIYKMVQSLFADPFISHARNEDIIYTLERDFSCFSLEAVIFSFSCQFTAVYPTIRRPINFQLVSSTTLGINSLFSEV